MALDASRLSSLRRHIEKEYLNPDDRGGDAFSADESKSFIHDLAASTGGLTERGLAHANTLLAEFAGRDVMSTTAIKSYLSELAKEVRNSPFLGSPTGVACGSSIAAVRSGASTGPVGTKLKDVVDFVWNTHLPKASSKITSTKAQAIVSTLAGGNLSLRRLNQLKELRRMLEADAAFSSAGRKAFDKALAEAVAKSTQVTAEDLTPSGAHAKGRALGNLPARMDLRLVKDKAIKSRLGRIDFNNDSVLDDKDRKKLGFSEEQWQAMMFTARLFADEDQKPATVPSNLEGKTICFTAVADAAAAKRYAEQMGAIVVNEVSENLDFLVVGDPARTGKDERARAFNLLNKTEDKDIKLTDWQSFLSAANETVATGELPAAIESIITDSFWGWNSTPEVTITNVSGNDTDGYKFDYASGDDSGTAYATKYDGDWVVTPKKANKAVFDAAVEAMKEHFDEYVAPDVREWGDVTEAEIAEMRDSIGIGDSAYLPHESSDPYGLTGDYDLVFRMSNPTGSDHGYFVGIDIDDPTSYEAYTFN